jgi:serine/threonine-protein kinase
MSRARLGDKTDEDDSQESEVETVAEVPSSGSGSSGAGVARGLHSPLQPLGFAERYSLERELGHGGMGQVLLCRDAQIGRRVAFKQLTANRRGQPGSMQHFVREARVQARLEHPAIVPVYDLGTSPEGELFFTMKRLEGMTLAEVLRDLRRQDERTLARFTVGRLLRDFLRICQVVEFAHRKGVVHRDIKPSNIMVGDFGEIYLLDWGVARSGEEEEFPRPFASGQAPLILGTPGYMSPEQIEDPSTVTAAADVFSLGCVLYELLSYQRAIEPDGVDILVATLDGVERPPSARADHDVPPELDELCMRALDVDPRGRPTLQELQADIEGYLDGERDRELRSQLADRHVDEAAGCLAEIRDAAEDADDTELRGRAVRAVGRALGLVPEHRRASKILVELLTEPPRKTPADVERVLDETDAADRKDAGRIAVVAYLTLFAYLPLFLWAGVHSWGPVVAYCVLAVASSVASYVVLRHPAPSARTMLIPMVVSTAAMASCAVLFGPLVLTPGIVAINLAAFAMTEGHKRAGLIISVGILGVIGPFALEVARLLPPSYSFSEGSLVIRSWALHLSGTPAFALLITGAVGNVVTAVAVTSMMRRANHRIRQKLELQRWQIRQLLP